VTFLTGSSDPAYDVSSPDFEGDRVENVEYDVDIQAAGGSGDNGNNDGNGANGLQFEEGRSPDEPQDGYLRFYIENTGSQSVTVEEIEVTKSGYGSLRYIERGGNELVISGDANGQLNTRINLDSPEELDQFATFQPGDRSTVNLRTFNNNGGQSVTLNPIRSSEGNQDLTVTFILSDGTRAPFYFEKE
jgi:hypothetical protein